MVTGFEIDFQRLLLYVIHERAFKTSTNYPFPYMIFQLCRAAGVPIWHIGFLGTSTGRVDIGLIRDDANEATQNKGPQFDVKSLGENLSYTVEQAKGLIRIL